MCHFTVTMKNAKEFTELTELQFAWSTDSSRCNFLSAPHSSPLYASPGSLSFYILAQFSSSLCASSLPWYPYPFWQSSQQILSPTHCLTFGHSVGGWLVFPLQVGGLWTCLLAIPSSLAKYPKIRRTCCFILLAWNMQLLEFFSRAKRSQLQPWIYCEEGSTTQVKAHQLGQMDFWGLLEQYQRPHNPGITFP